MGAFIILLTVLFLVRASAVVGRLIVSLADLFQDVLDSARERNPGQCHVLEDTQRFI